MPRVEVEAAPVAGVRHRSRLHTHTECNMHRTTYSLSAHEVKQLSLSQVRALFYILDGLFRFATLLCLCFHKYVQLRSVYSCLACAGA